MPLLTIQRSGRSKPVKVSVANPETAIRFMEAFVYSLRRDPQGWVTLTVDGTLVARYPRPEAAPSLPAQRRAA